MLNTRIIRIINIRFILLLPVFILLCNSMVKAQTREKRQNLLLEVVSTMENYERYASLDNGFSYNSSHFLDLFVNPDVMVYNDLVGLSADENITVKEYSNLLINESKTTRIDVRNIVCEKIFKEEDNWKIVCTFDKNVNLTNDCGVELSTDFFYDTDYKLRVTMVYLEDYEQCLIEKIEAAGAIQKKIPEQYMVLKYSNPLDKHVRANGEELLFNPMKQAFVPYNASFSYHDPDVQIKVVSLDEKCNISKLSYKSRRFRMRLHYDISLNEFYKVKTDDIISHSNSGSEFGLDFGYTIPSKSKVRTSFNLGLLYSHSSLDLYIKNHQFSYRTNADIDGDRYERCYENVFVHENLKMHHVGLPVYLDVDFCFNPIISFYLQLGVKPYLNLNSKVNSYSFDAYVYGVYSQYGNLILDENWGYNGFGNVHISERDLDVAELPVKSFYMNGFGGGGIRLKPLKKAPITIDLGVNYNFSVISNWEQSIKGNVASSLTDYSVDAGESPNLLNKFVSSCKRNNLNLNVGLIYKF